MPPINETPLYFNRNAAFSANETFRVDFPVPIGDSATNKGIGKGDKFKGNVDEESNNQYKGLSDSNLNDTQTTVLRDLNLITRSVASSEVSRQLGLQSVVAESYAKDPDGKNIGVSAMASGTQMLTNRVDENGFPQETITRSFDFKRGDIQKGLYDLEAVDYLTGQIDRHSGNIFINERTGQVEGIDNDLCFGEKPLSVATRDGQVGVKTTGAPPYYYHQDTAAAIERMTPEKLTAVLKGVTAPDGTCGLSDIEIGGAVERLKTMQANIQVARMQGRVVPGFNQDTFEASLEHHRQKAGEPVFGKYVGTGNYVGRSQLELEYATTQSQKPNSVDTILPPGDPRTLANYEALLKQQTSDIQQAKSQVLADPGPELQQPLQRKAMLEAQLGELNGEISSAMRANGSLQNRLVINVKADEALTKNLAVLSSCQASNANNPNSPAIDERQAKILKTMVPGIGELNAGDRLDQHQRTAVGVTLQKHRAGALAEQRAHETEAIRSFGVSVGSEAQQQKLAVMAELNEVDQDISRLVQQDPRVQQAVESRAQFVDTSRVQMIQEHDTAVKAKLDQLVNSLAESNQIPVASLNLKKEDDYQTPSRLRSSAVNNRDDAGTSKLAGDQMAGTVDFANLNESEQYAMEGTLQQLGNGSDLEVAKMYARSTELLATADVQDQFAAISKTIQEGNEPSQQQLENFGASVQALSEAAAKSREATQRVNASIEARIHNGLEAKVGPLLDKNGFTAQEKAASITALTGAAMDIDIMKLRDTSERADLYVDQLVKGIEESTFELPGGSNVHQAVYRAFDAVAIKDPAAENAPDTYSVKPAGGGQTFNERRANAFIEDALDKHDLPKPQLLQGDDRNAALAKQTEAGLQRMQQFENQMAAQGFEKAKAQDIAALQSKIDNLATQKQEAQTRLDKRSVVSNFLNKGGKTELRNEIAAIDQQTAIYQREIQVLKDKQFTPVNSQSGPQVSGSSSVRNAINQQPAVTFRQGEYQQNGNRSDVRAFMGSNRAPANKPVVEMAPPAIDAQESDGPKVDGAKNKEDAEGPKIEASDKPKEGRVAQMRALYERQAEPPKEGEKAAVKFKTS